MPIKLVIFDHDGVIVDSSGHIWSAIVDLCFEHPLFGSLAIPTFSNFLKFFRLPGDSWLNDYGFNFPTEVIKEALRHAPDTAEMFSMVPPMLKTLRANRPRLPIIMISAGDEPRIKKQLKEGEIRHHFDTVIGNTLDKAEAIYFFCLAFDIRPAEAVYVGVMPADLEHGAQAGVVTIGFTDDRPMMKRVLTAAGARHCVRDHQELGDLLIELTRT